MPVVWTEQLHRLGIGSEVALPYSDVLSSTAAPRGGIDWLRSSVPPVLRVIGNA